MLREVTLPLALLNREFMFAVRLARRPDGDCGVSLGFCESSIVKTKEKGLFDLSQERMSSLLALRLCSTKERAMLDGRSPTSNSIATVGHTPYCIGAVGAGAIVLPLLLRLVKETCSKPWSC